MPAARSFGEGQDTETWLGAPTFRVQALNARRTIDERPVTHVYLGLHIGDVFYGNIGSVDRLDFTVVGPAVNEVSRIAAMCRSADRSELLSSDFVAATPRRRRPSAGCWSQSAGTRSAASAARRRCSAAIPGRPPRRRS